MRIPIKPVQVFVVNQGLVTASMLDVNCGRLVLGEGASAQFRVLAIDGTDPKNPKELCVANGEKALTAEQFAAWGTDDGWFAKCTAQNIGLEPGGS